jgi:hypothetical protein
MYELTNYDFRNGHGIKFGLLRCFPNFAQKKMLTSKKLLQRAVKYFSDRWRSCSGRLSTLPPAIATLPPPLQLLQWVVKYFTARWSLEPGAGGKVLLYRPPEPRKQACKEETRTSRPVQADAGLPAWSSLPTELEYG